MRVLFLHNNFPAQYRALAPYVGSMPDNEVYFGTMNSKGELQNVKKVYYKLHRKVNPQTHHYLQNAENAVLHGQAVYRMAQSLKRRGFYPDIVCAHSGWGPPHFIKDVYPHTKLLAYFEWYYRATGSDYNFLPNDPNDEDGRLKLRMKNVALQMDMVGCDHGVCPTQWQWSQIPEMFQEKISVIHDGIDTDLMQPAANVSFTVPNTNITLTQNDEVLTYVARGMEPYRGFPQLMQALAVLQKRRPNLQVIIAGQDRVAYGRSLPEKQTYKQKYLKELDLDLSRIHFTGLLSYRQLAQAFQVSSLHLYLTVPFVLSWSMLEAMAAGCVVLGSATAPVEEMIEDGKNGFLVDFFSVDDIVVRAEDILTNQDKMQDIRKRARQSILDNYALDKMLAKHYQLMQDVINS